MRHRHTGRRWFTRAALGLSAAVVLPVLMTGTASAANSTIPGGNASIHPTVGVACAGSGSTIRVHYAYAVVTGQEMGGSKDTPAGGCTGSFYPPQGTFRHFHLCNLTTKYCGPEVTVQ
ncbi:hypothetical protein [Actinophytocola oryzae]|nr:hypothetical protein [Actinophytocola oryzae]